MGEQQTRYTSIVGDEKNEFLAHRYHMDMDKYLTIYTIIYPNALISCTVVIWLIFNII
jgi:hypothetical protein